MILLAASLFFADPSPMEMPKADAYLVSEDGVRRLEDRYDRTDLWISRSVDGMWVDDSGREFMLATLATIPPPITDDAALTREDFAKSCVRLGKKDEDGLFAAVDKLSPVAPSREFFRPRQNCRGYRDIRYYQGTNEAAVVCAFLLEKRDTWRLATWTLAEGDVYDDCVKTFERKFLESRESWPKGWCADAEDGEGEVRGRKARRPGERSLLRADARHSVALYDNWHATDGEEFCVLDDIQLSRDFTIALTNDLKLMRAAYARTVPSPIDGSNVLAVARIFASRGEYLDSLGQNDLADMEWSAAYWSPQRRELVAYLPEDGSEKLLRTIRHEAFHQYLSYATSMIPASPWLNEGYAQYFEGGPEGPSFVDPAELVQYADLLPALMAMDYGAFYSGTDEERAMKYRLALSIVYFLERGAHKVRFDPFRNVKRDYMEFLLDHRDMLKATTAAFKTKENIDLFVREWTKFWKKQ